MPAYKPTFTRRSFSKQLMLPYWVNRLGLNSSSLGKRLVVLGSLGFGSTKAQVAAQVTVQPFPTQTPLANAPVLPTNKLNFPRDFGAHLEYKTEWWYLSGWLDRKENAANAVGVQATFFRTRTDYNLAGSNAFAPRQLVLAHMALAVPEKQKLLHDQKSARLGLGAASVSGLDTDCALYGWRFKRVSSVENGNTKNANQESYVVQARCNTHLQSQAFALDLQFKTSAAPVLQGKQGFSQKGPLPLQASHYYSRPQLIASGNIELDKKVVPVTGTAWLDHEWSSTLLDPNAVGWDWIGINLSNGGSLLAFRLRSKDNANVWSYAVLRDEKNAVVQEGSSEQAVKFTGLKNWRSIVSGAVYPVSQQIEFGANRYSVEPAFEAQEIDGRLSTGGFYWEGAVRLRNGNGEIIGRGYLEMTGYSNKIRI
jgi:predicted secreted hydrolase